jgi:N-acetylglucosaminyldiphosphoundecaprenol N-acetyl-beta-D-mannosaminyltransferase
MRVIGIRIDDTTYSSVSNQVVQWTESEGAHYVCAANVHMIMEAYDSIGFRNLVNSADLVTADGMPLVWLMRAKGRRSQQRVYGPTLMLHILEIAAQKKIPVGFYGSKPDVLNILIKRMMARYEGLEVVYSFSPPFRMIDPKEDAVIVKQIIQSGARILFVGLGCPKQEIWMAEHCEKVNLVMLGVGAAFDFHASVKPQAPSWLQRIGLEWLFRLATEPRRLWKRYLYHNPRFIFLAVADLLGLLKKIN